MSKLKSFGIFALGMSLGIGFCIAAGKYRQKLNEKSKKTWNDSMKEVGIDLDKAVEEEVRDEDTAEKKYRSEPELNRMNEELCGTDDLVEKPDVFKIKEEVQKQTWGEVLENFGVDIGKIPEKKNDDS